MINKIDKNSLKNWTKYKTFTSYVRRSSNTITVTNDGFTISMNLYEKINKPKYLSIFYDDRIIALSSSEKDDGYLVYKREGTNGAIYLRNRTFIKYNKINKMMYEGSILDDMIVFIYKTNEIIK